MVFCAVAKGGSANKVSPSRSAFVLGMAIASILNFLGGAWRPGQSWEVVFPNPSKSTKKLVTTTQTSLPTVNCAHKREWSRATPFSPSLLCEIAKKVHRPRLSIGILLIYSLISVVRHSTVAANCPCKGTLHGLPGLPCPQPCRDGSLL